MALPVPAAMGAQSSLQHHIRMIFELLSSAAKMSAHIIALFLNSSIDPAVQPATACCKSSRAG